MSRWSTREKHLVTGTGLGVSKLIKPTLFSRFAAKAAKLVRETSGSGGFASRTPDGDCESVLDLEKLRALEDVMPGKETDSFVELCLADTDSHLAAIAEAAKRMDLAAIARSAHVLVSTAGNVGAMAVSLGARHLTDACRANDRAAAQIGIKELEAAHRAASDALRAWLAARSAEPQAAGRA